LFTEFATVSPSHQFITFPPNQEVEDPLIDEPPEDIKEPSIDQENNEALSDSDDEIELYDGEDQDNEDLNAEQNVRKCLSLTKKVLQV